MFTDKDFKVTLVNSKEVGTFVEQHGRFASVCYDTPKEKAFQVGVGCLKSGHFSGSRHLYFVFDLENIPRFVIDQLVRHEVGVVKNVQSLRYVNKKDSFSVYVAPEVYKNLNARDDFRRAEEYLRITYNLGLKHLAQPLAEDDLVVEDLKRRQEIYRSLVPIGISSSCSFACNLEALIHICNLRLCTRAEHPMRVLVKKMREEVVKAEPLYATLLAPQCVKLGYCPEGKMGCGAMSTREDYEGRSQQ